MSNKKKLWKIKAEYNAILANLAKIAKSIGGFPRGHAATSEELTEQIIHRFERSKEELTHSIRSANEFYRKTRELQKILERLSRIEIISDSIPKFQLP